MPVYEFRTDDGEVVEVSLSFAEHDRRVKNDTIKLDDGRTAKRVWGGATSLQHRSIATCPGNYPMVSSAAGVHPADIKKHMDHLRSMGCGTVHHNKDGDVIFESKDQRKKVCEALGLFDRNGSYGDPQAKHRTANVRRYR